MIEETSLALLTLVMAFVRQKYNIYIYIYIYFFYGVIICDKHDSIVSIKKGISDKHEAIENGKIFWRENAPLLFTFVTTFVHCN